MKLSEKLIKLRKEKGLSQEEFGNEINVSRQAVSKWENEETKPDLDKIKEIVKKFKVDYNYLLNDEIETEKKDNITKISNTIPNKPKHKVIIKVILVIFLLYLVICVYKFVAFYRFYWIANSFSEEKYWMIQTIETSSNESSNIRINTIKMGNKILQKMYFLENSEIIKDEKGETLPYEIEFTDINQKICYRLNYDKDKKIYDYYDRKKDAINGEEMEKLFSDKNRIKENTLAIIPSGFKEIFLASIDPRYYYVSMANRQFKTFLSSDKIKLNVQLNKDYLVESIKHKFEDNQSTVITFNYDYVQDHFEEIKAPHEEYSNKILWEE